LFNNVKTRQLITTGYNHATISMMSNMLLGRWGLGNSRLVVVLHFALQGPRQKEVPG